VLAEAQRWRALTPYSRPAIVNGVAGAVVGRPDGTVFTVVALTVANGRISAIDFLVDPAKLARLSLT
jgi:RNA polymerase sigma-70 factor (ECF subfamily)